MMASGNQMLTKALSRGMSSSDVFTTKERLEVLIETAMEGIAAVDPEENFMFVNKSFTHMLGYSKDELLGMNLKKLADQKNFEMIRQQTRQREKGETTRYELVFRRKDKKLCIVQVSASPLWNDDGSFAGGLGIVMDITQRKKAEEALKEIQKQMVKKERLAAIGELAAIVGHDLRNPLTSIAAAAYYLKMKLNPRTEHRVREMLEIIEKDIDYSNKIIDDLLDYSREINLELTRATPKSILNDALSQVKIPKNIQVKDSTKDEPRIRVDKEKMKRVFINLIKNAIEAMPKGGRLTISSRKTSKNCEITFSDTGSGMTKDVMEKIWTPLFTTKSKGMGLGLSICKRFIEAHNGKISVKSRVDHGVTFTLTVPTKPV